MTDRSNMVVGAVPPVPGPLGALQGSAASASMDTTTTQASGRRRRIDEADPSSVRGSPIAKRLPRRDIGPLGTVPALGGGEPVAMTVEKLHEMVVNMQALNDKRYDLIHDTTNAHAAEIDSRPRKPATRAEIDGVHDRLTKLERISEENNTTVEGLSLDLAELSKRLSENDTMLKAVVSQNDDDLKTKLAVMEAGIRDFADTTARTVDGELRTHVQDTVQGIWARLDKVEADPSMKLLTQTVATMDIRCKDLESLVSRVSTNMQESIRGDKAAFNEVLKGMQGRMSAAEATAATARASAASAHTAAQSSEQAAAAQRGQTAPTNRGAPVSPVDLSGAFAAQAAPTTAAAAAPAPPGPLLGPTTAEQVPYADDPHARGLQDRLHREARELAAARVDLQRREDELRQVGNASAASRLPPGAMGVTTHPDRATLSYNLYSVGNAAQAAGLPFPEHVQNARRAGAQSSTGQRQPDPRYMAPELLPPGVSADPMQSNDAWANYHQQGAAMAPGAGQGNYHPTPGAQHFSLTPGGLHPTPASGAIGSSRFDPRRPIFDH